MQIEKEIEQSVKRIVASNKDIIKTQKELDTIILHTKEALINSQYDFTNANSIILNQNGKKRFVKHYEDIYSVENILCHCIKQILDRVFRIRYPNRNKTIKTLFSVLSAVRQMSDFTIIKFDFKDYFNSISATYVFEKFLKPKLLDRFEINLIRDFTYNTEYAYAGFCTSNVIAEIAAKYFDEMVKQIFASKGVIYFERYIDDSILVLNEYIEEQEIKDMLNKSLLNIFYDEKIQPKVKCKAKFNNKKYQYITRRLILKNPGSIDYLGYNFLFSYHNDKDRIEIKYGITPAKQAKYRKRLDKLISCYADKTHQDYGNLELLRHKIAAFTSREVYLNKRFHSNVWKVKGFISNYGELRHLLETDLIEDTTMDFLKNVVKDAFTKASIPLPYFISRNSQRSYGYNLYENMKSNKTILLVDHIGYDYNSLVKLCKQIGINNINVNGKKRGYGTLVRDYLIKIKVGY